MQNRTRAFSAGIGLFPIDYVLCAVLALAFSASPYYIETGECPITLSFVLHVCFLFPAFLLCTGLIRKRMESEKPLLPHSRIGRIFDLFDRTMEKPFHLLLIAAVIFLCWLPVLVFLYPGTLINDTWGQLNQFIRFAYLGGGLEDHHPVFDTLLMGAAIVPLSELTGRWQMVIFAYVLGQAAFTSLAFSCTIDYLYHKLKLGAGAALFTLLAYCVLPLYPASVQTVSKDALFSWIYVLFAVQFTEYVRSRGDSLNSRRNRLFFTALMILCCLTKKVGIYVVLPSYMIAWFVLQRRS